MGAAVVRVYQSWCRANGLDPDRSDTRDRWVVDTGGMTTREQELIEEAHPRTALRIVRQQ